MPRTVLLNPVITPVGEVKARTGDFTVGDGGATTFAQYLMEVEPGSGSGRPEPQTTVEGFVLVVAFGLLEPVAGVRLMRAEKT